MLVYYLYYYYSIRIVLCYILLNYDYYYCSINILVGDTKASIYIIQFNNLPIYDF